MFEKNVSCKDRATLRRPTSIFDTTVLPGTKQRCIHVVYEDNV